MKTTIKICSGVLAAAALMPGYAMAAYSADTETGMDALDYIENQHRLERENRLDAGQKQVLKDTAEMKKHLRQPVDPKNLPTAFEGDDLTYDQNTGAFEAKGHVKITRLDNSRFTSDLVTGNTKTQDVVVNGKAHVIQMAPAQPSLNLDGYKTNYNYGKKTGTMEDASGKVDHQYVTGKRFEFYPDEVVIYDGTATKCSAKKPDYHLSADKIEIWPNKKMIMHHVKFWIGHVMLYRRNLYEVDLTPGAKNQAEAYPRVGYDSDNGIWIRKNESYPLAKNVTFNPEILYTGHFGLRNSANVNWAVGSSNFQLDYGYYEDNNSHWIKKQPSFIYTFSHRLGSQPFSYNLKYERGQWYNNGIHSTHTYYWLGLSRDDIHFGKGYTLKLSAGYSITKESYDHSNINGFNYDATLVRDISPRWAAYVGYHYSQTNSKNSLFNYNTDDYSRKLEAGVSYRIDDRNRIAVGNNYDMDGKTLKDTDIYWYHDMHCAQLILKYRAKRHTFGASLQFTPW